MLWAAAISRVRGATLGEYALILVAILLLAGGAYKLLGNPTGKSATEARRWLEGKSREPDTVDSTIPAAFRAAPIIGMGLQPGTAAGEFHPDEKASYYGYGVHQAAQLVAKLEEESPSELSIALYDSTGRVLAEANRIIELKAPPGLYFIGVRNPNGTAAKFRLSVFQNIFACCR